MTTEEHQQRHIELHKSLDELIADYISCTQRTLSETSVMEFLNWSYAQTINPQEVK